MRRDLRVVLVHNQYRTRGGEDSAVQSTASALARVGVRVIPFMRDSREIGDALGARLRAAGSSIYSFTCRRRLGDLLARERPHVVHVHNVYPLISLSILDECRRRGVPVVMTLHNFRFLCPIGTCVRRGRECSACISERLRELACARENCRGNRGESILYALRTWVARRIESRYGLASVFVAPSRFLIDRYVASGFCESRFALVRNMTRLPETAADPSVGKYVAFVGRFSPEKGVEVVLEAMRSLSGVPLQLAGDLWAGKGTHDQRSGAVMAGFLSGGDLDAFYRGARMVVFPSVGPEVCPLVPLEAMSHGIPVIASRCGGVPEVVRHGVSGLLATPGDPAELRSAIERLWADPGLCRSLGQAGRDWVAVHHSESRFVSGLLAVYERVANAV